MIRRIFHKLFVCPTFWQVKAQFECPECFTKYRCYWDGADCWCGTIHLCAECYTVRHALHDYQGATN